MPYFARLVVAGDVVAHCLRGSCCVYTNTLTVRTLKSRGRLCSDAQVVRGGSLLGGVTEPVSQYTLCVCALSFLAPELCMCICVYVTLAWS